MKPAHEVRAYLLKNWIKNSEERDKIRKILRSRFKNDTDFELRILFTRKSGITVEKFKKWLNE